MLRETDSLLKAAAEPTRLRILNLLRLGSVCVCDLQWVLELPPPTVSRHLSTLRHAGLVADRRQGNRTFYSLSPATTPQIKALRQLVESCSVTEEVLQIDLRRLAEALKGGQCLASDSDKENSLVRISPFPDTTQEGDGERKEESHEDKNPAVQL